MDYKEILDYSLFEYDQVKFQVNDVLELLMLLGATRLIIWLVSKYLNRKIKKHVIDEGKGYSITQIIKYFVFTIAIVIAMDITGINITALLFGSTALFVGLGLGLQDTFKDFVSGVVLLVERSVSTGDIIEVGELVGRVKEVRLRTTLVETRQDIIIVIPNSKLINDNVINWSQNRKATRFSVSVGVAYGSDTSLVKQLLLEAVKDHSMVAKDPAPSVFFEDFGDSSLQFRVLFYSHYLFRIEKVKSDIRFSIDQKFRDQNVTIPFPQRDLWVKQWPNDPNPATP